MTRSREVRPSTRCPMCGKSALYAAENPLRPFCSARCRDTDLGTWASEGYRVTAGNPSDVEPPAEQD